MTSVYPGPGLGDHPVAPDPRPASLLARILYPEWGPIVAGAIAAAALALVLHAFAVAIGLSVSSTAPTWQDASFALVLLSGLYVVLAALASYGVGGYLAGLMCTRLSSREEQVLAIAEHEHLPEIAATALAQYLSKQAHGMGKIRDMIVHDIRQAQQRQDKSHVLTLLHVLHHFLKSHPEVCPPQHPWSQLY